MLNLTYKDTPNIEQYAKDIGAEGTFVYVNRAVMETFYYECCALYATAEHNLKRYIQDISRNAYYEAKSDSVLSTLLRYCGVKQERLTLAEKGESRLSLDMTKIVNPLLDDLVARIEQGVPDEQLENAILLLAAYKDFQSAKTRCSQCKSKLNKLSQEEYDGWGIPLNKVNFRYVMSETGRFYTREDSIQNWPLEIVPSISADMNHFLLWADFDQIDMRVGYHLFLREPGSAVDKIYQAADDKYRAMYEIICNAANKKPDFDLFTKYRKAYKKAILSAMYNASEKSLAEDIKNKELAHELFEFFKHNKKYQHYRSTIDKSIQFNVDLVVKDYFGFKRGIAMPSLKNDWEINDAISKCCNTPVQSTSNSIVMLWVEALLAEFEKHGYQRGVDVQPYLIRHDECVFRVSKSVMKDLWIFKNCMEIAIDDWDTLSLEPHCGFSYKRPIPELEEIFENCCLANAHQMTPRLVTAPRDNVYRAIDEVLEVYAYSFTRFIDHAKELYESGESRPFEADPNDANFWNEERAVEVITPIVDSSEFYRELLTFRDTVIVHSSKLDKYTTYKGVDYVVELAKRLGTNKVNAYSLTLTTALMHKDIMFKFRSDAPEKTKKIMRSMRDLGFPAGEWVSIDV